MLRRCFCRCLPSAGRRLFASSSGRVIPEAEREIKRELEILREPVKRPLGQPSPHTHPHLLAAEEVTPGISKGEYSERRSRLLEGVVRELRDRRRAGAESDCRTLILVAAAKEKFSGPDVPYPFRQDSNFLYLSGLREKDAVLAVYTTGAGCREAESALFVLPRDAHKELWQGARAGADGAVDLTGVELAGELTEFQLFLESFAKDSNCRTEVCFDPESFKSSEFVRELFAESQGRGNGLRFSGLPLKPFVHRLRWRKSTAEAELMRRAGRAGAGALKETIKFARPGMEEHVLGAKMDLESRLRGANALAYPPVVAGGNRANTIHYLTCDQLLRGDELVLMDAGADYFGYVSDITRTWPVSGRWSPSQQAVYEAVLEVHSDLLRIAAERRPIVLNELQQEMHGLLAKQLCRLGILSESLSLDEQRKFADKCCPHHVSHYLGMDVHDTSSVSRAIAVEPGVVFTVEPGIYFPESAVEVPAEFRGIGVRVEDDVLLTETGMEVLSQACPKTVEELNVLMSVR